MKDTGQPPSGAPPSRTRSSSHGESIFRSAGIVSLAVALSRVSGLVRETFMAHQFGAGLQNDAFSLGFRIPNLTRDLFAEGALSSAFVPTFTQYLSTKGKEEAARLSNLVATMVIMVVGTLCILGMAFSPALVGWLAHGWKATAPEKFNLAVDLTRIMFPFLLLVALAAQAMGILNACNRFGVPAMSSTFFNLGSVAFGYVIGFIFGPRIGISGIEGMAYGVVLGGALQLFWQLPSLRRAGISFRPAIDWSHPGLRHIIRLMGPAIIGNAAIQVNVAVNTNFASMIVDRVRGVDGPVSWLQFAFRFMQLPLGLFGVAIASATLPAISRSASSGNLEEFRSTLSRSLGMVFLLTVPSSIGLAVLGDSMIGVIYEVGRFQAYDTHQTALALSCYALGLAGYSAIKVLAPAFYALGNSRVPMMVSLVTILINFVVAWAMTTYTRLGHAGLALATSGVALFSFVTLFWLMRERLEGIHGRELLNSTVRILAASLVMGGVILLTNHGIHAWLGFTRLSRFVDLLVSIPLGGAVFYAACYIMRVRELDAVQRAVGRPLQRFIPFWRDRIDR